jgi:hypothetical protein
MENTDPICTQAPLTRAALDDLAAKIVAGAGQVSAQICRWLLLVAEFDAADAAPIFGLASTAQWLSYSCGIAGRTAAEHVRVARALQNFPRLAEEMSVGRLSYSQARAISRVPRPGEFGLVDNLIEVARYGTAAQLEVMVRGLRTVDHNERGLDQSEREYVAKTWTAESLWRLSARLDPERGAVVTAALRRVAESEQLGEADALVRLAEIGLAALEDSQNPPRALRGDERAAIVVHLDASKMAHPTEEGAAPDGGEQRAAGAAMPGATDSPARRSAEPERPYARIANGPGLPDRVVRRLLCAGRIRTVLHDAAGNVLDVGRSHRLVTDRQYRALLLRQHGHCAHPGCPNTRNLDAHHVLFWFLGGRTDLDNLVILCERHHVSLHDGDFRIVALGRGRFRFERRDGMNLATPPKTQRIDDHEVLDVAPDAARPLWGGQRLDRPYAISVLAQHRYRVEPSRSGSDPGDRCG